jgi:hypothetical protein
MLMNLGLTYHKVVVAAFAVDLRRKTVRVTIDFTTSSAGYHHRESGEDFTHGATLEPASRGKIRPVSIRFELTICTMTESVYDSFRNSLAIKMNDFLAHGSVLEEIKATRSSTK